MKKQTFPEFRKLVKENKQLLIDSGIGRAAIISYIYTDRVPKIETAIRIAELLKIPVSDIPSYTVYRG